MPNFQGLILFKIGLEYYLLEVTTSVEYENDMVSTKNQVNVLDGNGYFLAKISKHLKQFRPECTMLMIHGIQICIKREFER